MKTFCMFSATALFAVLFASHVFGADIAVGEECGLADAIVAANIDKATGGCNAGNGADVITLSADVTLEAELPRVTTDITIKGGGHTISGEGAYRIFYVEASGTLTIERLAMRGGKAGKLSLPSGVTTESSGGIVNFGTISIENSAFSDNSADQAGGGIVNAGTLIIINSSFSGNSAEKAGAIVNEDDGRLIVNNSKFARNSANEFAGAIFNTGTLSIENSAFSDNSADQAGAIFNAGTVSIEKGAFSDNSTATGSGGAIANAGTLSIENSAFAGNLTEQSGGAIFNHLDLSVINSSFTENQAYFGGAIHLSGDSENLPTVEMTHATLVYNSAERGGGVLVEPNSYKAVNLYNSIFAGNTGGDCIGGLNNGTGHPIQDGSCDAKISSDPLLGDSVQPDDGSPPYHPLLSGSPAIDSAVSEYCPDSDQIGTPRPLNAACDKGAIEFVHEE